MNVFVFNYRGNYYGPFKTRSEAENGFEAKRLKDKSPYASPEIAKLTAIHEMTESEFNKRRKPTR